MFKTVVFQSGKSHRIRWQGWDKVRESHGQLRHHHLEGESLLTRAVVGLVTMISMVAIKLRQRVKIYEEKANTETLPTVL